MADDMFDNLLEQMALQKAQAAVPSTEQPAAGTADAGQAPVKTTVPQTAALSQGQSLPQDQPNQNQTSQEPADPLDALIRRKQSEKLQNNPDSDGSVVKPINESPLSISDRAKLSVGNQKGSLTYLKKRFEDATFTEKDGLLVKSGGAWHKVDASGFGQYFRDPWELTKDIADLGDIAINAVGTTIAAGEGAAAAAPLGLAAGPAGAAVAGAAGGIAGAMGGGAASGALRTSLGRLVGTYEADAPEQIKDIGLEALLSAGGQAVALGAKPVLGQLVKAGGVIASTASNTAKEALSEALGASTGAGKSAIKTIIENAPEYGATFSRIAKGATGGEDIVNRAVAEQIAHTDTLLTSAAKELPNQYGKLLDNLVDAAGKKKIQVDTTAVLGSAATAIEDNGFGRVVQNGKNYKFIPFKPEEVGARAAQGLPVELLDDKAAAEIAHLVNQMAGFSKIGTLEGKAGAKALQVMNKTLNQISSDAFKGQISPSAARAIGKVTEGFRNGVSDQFEKHGLGEQYGAMQEIYTTFAKAVNGARSVLKNDGQEALMKKLTSAAGKNMTAKGDVSLLVQLAGKTGEDAYKNIVLADAVKNTASWAPKLSMPFKVGGAAAAGVGIGHASALMNPVVLPVAAAAATQFSPRLVGKQLQYAAPVAKAVGAGTRAITSPIVDYAFKSLDFLRTLSQPALKQFLNNPKAINDVFQAPIGASQNELQDQLKILQDNGAIPGGK